MATGRERFQERRHALALLGKSLTRRAGSSCELCGEGQDLRPTEVPPVADLPELVSAALFCVRCRELNEGGKLPKVASDLRFLETSVWSELLPVQLAAVRLLTRVAADEVDWAVICLEGLWLPEEVKGKIDV